MKYEIFDAHCDTALKLYFDGKSLYDSDCMVSTEKCENYKKATYTMAIFNDKSLKCADIFAIIEKIKTETKALKHTNFDTVIAVEGLGNTPDLTLADVEKLAKSEFVPNLTIAAGPDFEIKRDERPRKTDFGAFTTITMDIPIFNHGQAGVMRAKAQRNVYEKQLNDTKNQILLELKNCYADFVQTEKSLKIYQTELLPKSKDVLAKSEYSFKEGKSDILMSLNAQEAYIRIKTDYINTLENYYNSLGNLERAVGVNNENL